MPSEPQFTGRYLVLLAEGGESIARKAVSKAAGIKNIASTADFKTEDFSADAVSGAEGLVLSEIGVMIVDAEPDRVAAVADLEPGASGILATEPEQICYALGAEQGAGFATTPDYVRGYRDAVNQLADAVLGGKAAAEELVALSWVETRFTWGLQATRVPPSRYTGKGIQVAVLDTGLDLQHPDFKGRTIVSKSFVAGQPVQDGHGHGTHCIGTACGPKHPPLPPPFPPPVPRYGIAYEAAIYAGKVLSNQGSGGRRHSGRH